MAQMRWVYLDNKGGRHAVGLYHGDRTGHLAIYCNSKIVQVDFSVKETQMYSFFIEDELCEVHIVKEKTGLWGYEFRVNKEVDTPRNRERKKELKIEKKQIGYILGGLAVFVVLFLIFNRYQKDRTILDYTNLHSFSANLSPDELRQLRKEGKSAVATFFKITENGNTRLYYSFTTADSLKISGALESEGNTELILPSGFPLSDRDAFHASYLAGNPKQHRIDFLEPQPITLRRYFELALSREKTVHPEKSDRKIRCFCESVVSILNWKSLAVIYAQPGNSEQDLMKEREYQKLVENPDIIKNMSVRCPD